MNAELILQTLVFFAFGLLAIRAVSARIKRATAKKAKEQRRQRQRNMVDQKASTNKRSKAATKPRESAPEADLRQALIAGTQLT